MFDDKLELSLPMKHSYLIQRLKKPLGHVATPYTFGAGGNRLTKEHMVFLRSILTFDYMGLAEFEWGAIPAALDLLTEQANQEQLVAGEHRGVYFVSPSLYEQGVCHVIDQLLDEDERKLYLVDYCGLAKALQARGTESAIEVVGWLELDNGFFFFADQDMFEKTKQLFGVSTDLPRQ